MSGVWYDISDDFLVVLGIAVQYIIYMERWCDRKLRKIQFAGASISYVARVFIEGIDYLILSIMQTKEIWGVYRIGQRELATSYH